MARIKGTVRGKGIRGGHFALILLILAIFAASLSALLYGIRQSINFYKTPSEISDLDIQNKAYFRLAGLVERGSIRYLRSQAGLALVYFTIYDPKNPRARFAVTYEGVLPNLFREEQEVVAQGYIINAKLFKADQILAKHDETYRPS